MKDLKKRKAIKNKKKLWMGRAVVVDGGWMDGVKTKREEERERKS